jgi:hypothetical protein
LPIGRAVRADYPSTQPYPKNMKTLACLAWLAGAAALAFGQNNSNSAAAGGQLLEISIVTLKPDKVAEYERIQKEEVNPALKKAGMAARYFFKGGAFGESYVYGTAIPVQNLAFFDGKRPLERVLGKFAADALVARINACHASKRVFTSRQVPDLCWGQTFSPVAVVVTHQIAPGRSQEFLAYLRAHEMPVIRKSSVLGFAVEEIVLGSAADTVVTLGFWRSYADLDKGPAAMEVLGREGYEKLRQKIPAGVLVARETRVIEFQPDMSFGPSVSPSPSTASGQ